MASQATSGASAAIPVMALVSSYAFNYTMFGTPFAHEEWAYLPSGIALAPLGMVLVHLFPYDLIAMGAQVDVQMAVLTGVSCVLNFLIGYFVTLGVGFLINGRSPIEKPQGTGTPPVV